jgi:hypothetical protein
MKQAWTRFPLFPATLLLALGATGGCGVSDATKGLFVPEGEGGGASTSTGDPGLGGAGGATGSTSSGADGGGGVEQTTTTTSTGGSGLTLDCGNETCPQGDDSACCWSGGGNDGTGACIQGPPSDATCNTQPTSDGRRTRVECQLPSHCGAGESCCGDREPQENQRVYTTVSCAAQCAWPDVILCDPESPSCPIVETERGRIQTSCQTTARLPGSYFVCLPSP